MSNYFIVNKFWIRFFLLITYLNTFFILEKLVRKREIEKKCYFVDIDFKFSIAQSKQQKRILNYKFNYYLT